jgi:hypothetical protein
MYLKDRDTLKEALLDIQLEQSIQGVLLFGCDKNNIPQIELEAILKVNGKPLLGGIFPEIIADGERKGVGFVLIPLYEFIDICVYETNKEDKDEKPDVESCLIDAAKDIAGVFCFVNALWEQKTSFMYHLYDELGPFVNYLGGGAGSLSFKSFPCVFANHKVIEHGAVIGLTRNPLSIGVAHGWLPISEPIKVTETCSNTVISLNWQPAFEVYKSKVELHSKKTITEENFFEIAKSYPLGLVRLDDEMIIRDPYSTERGMLNIVDEVPGGEYIRIMHGNMASLLEGANSAVSKSKINTQDEITQFCIDCISRVLFMQEEFTEELSFLNQNQTANGILSIGEIANPGNASLELFNKTVVIAQWKKKI